MYTDKSDFMRKILSDKELKESFFRQHYRLTKPIQVNYVSFEEKTLGKLGGLENESR